MMLEAGDRFALPKIAVENSTAALRGIDKALQDLKLRYLSAVAAAVGGRGEWSEVATVRADLEEAGKANVALRSMWPD